jgi:hypothetical protein
MSGDNLIYMPGMEGSSPDFKSDREAQQWMAGKPTRYEVGELLKRDAQATQMAMNHEFAKIGNTFGQLIGMVRTQGLEMEALVVCIDRAVPGFREGYIKEFQKQSEFVMFLEGFTKEGEHSDKPIREKLDMARAWNAQEDVVQIYGDKFLFKKFIEAHHTEFTPDELSALQTEFGVSFQVLTVKQEEV